MAQETAASMTAPRAWVFYAWLDAALHPRFATFQRWFPLMKARWLMLSLIVSLVLILITACAGIALAAYSTMHTADALAPGNLFAYLTDPNGLSRAIFYGPCAIVTLFAMPAAVALISPRHLGPYSIRFKRVFRPWMQVQPIICLLQLFSAVAQLVLLLIGVDATESFLSESFLSGLMTVTLVVAPLLGTWSYSVAALSAGGGRKPFLTGLVAAIPGILALAAFGFAHSAVLK
jgi:hypothetical protein